MKRILYTLIGIMLSTGAWADTLQEQINNAEAGATITLDADVTLDNTLIIPADKNITLDLNGYSITSSASGAVAVKNNGTLTVKDTSGEKAGKIISTKYAGIGAGDNSTTTFESGNIESVEGAIITGKVIGATITINGGTFSATDNAVIMGNGSARDGSANTITINGGTFNGQIKSAGYVACGIYAPWKDVITVNGGTFNITGGCGILARAGSVTIKGGEFNCTGTATGKVGDSRVVVPCSAIVYDSEAGYPAMTAESKIEVPSTSTAKFSADPSVPAVSVVKNDGVDSHIEISGGAYSSPLTEDVCADGYIPSNTPNAEGKYEAKAGTYVAQIGTTKYETLAEAVAAVPTDGTATTITMLADVELTATVATVYGQNMILDLNNHNITSTVLAIKNLGDLEVTGTGNITVNGTKNTLYGISNAGAAGKKANLIIGENVTVTAPCVAVLTSYGKTIVNGTLANTQADASNIYSTLYLSQTSSEVIVAESAKVTGVVNAIYGAKGTLEVNSTNVGKIYADGSATQGLKIKKTTAIESLNVVGHAEFSDVADYYVAAKAFSACTGTVKLLSDVNGALALSAGKTVTLDLNGHKVVAETYPIKVEGNLTITGEGTVQSTGMGSSTSVQAAAYVLKNGKLTIESGNYVAGYVGEDGNPAVYVRDNAVVEIKGGDFVGGSKYLLNKLDASQATSTIEVTGGTFHNGFNPADNIAEGEHTNFVAEGYKAVDNGDDSFTVKEKDYVAQVGDNKYESLSEAVAAATEGQTVTLLENITLEQRVEPNGNITIDLGGNTITTTATCGNGSAFDVKGGTVTIKNGNIDGTQVTTTECDAITARSGSNVTLENLNITVNSKTGACAYAFAGGHITINSGTYKNITTEPYPHKEGFKALVVNQANVATQLVTINGGTFLGQNPADGDDAGLMITYLPENLATQLNAEGFYEIIPAKVQIGVKGYATITEALEEAKATETIKLLADAQIETINDWKEGVSLAKNGHELKVNTFEVIDFQACNIPFDFTANTATYTRDVAGNEWGTVCVPFTLKSTETIKLYTFGNISGNVLTVNEANEATPGTPVIFANTAKAASVTFTTENASVEADAPATEGTLIGTYTAQTITENLLGNIYFINGNRFHQAQVSLTVPAYRAYIKNTAAAAKPSILNILVGGEATGVEKVSMENESVEGIYDVNGMKLSTPKKGMNIMKLANGKTVKLIVK